MLDLSYPQKSGLRCRTAVFKVAIGESRIVSVKDRIVTFKYQKHGSRRYRTMSLDVIEFIRRFLQHVLPSGFIHPG